MPKGTAVLLATFGLGMFAAGCGGGGTAHYAVDPTASCLASLSGVEVDPDRTNIDFIAQQASGGTLRITASGAEAILSFASDATQATGIEKQYAAVQQAFGGAKLERKGNVVIAWSEQPSGTDDSAVGDCLKRGAVSSTSRYQYPPAVLSAFVNGCANTQRQCTCVIQRAQREYSFAEFRQITAGLNDPSSPFYAKAQKLINACR